MEMMLAIFFCAKRLMSRPDMMAAGMKPRRYPPVGPASLATPPWKPENTGRPVSPIKRYMMTLMALFFAPRRYTLRNTANVVSDMGTGPMGMDRGPSIHIMAANRAMMDRSLIFECLYDMFVFLSVNIVFVRRILKMTVSSG